MIEAWGAMPDGTAVERVALTGGGLRANVLSYGAVIQDLRLDGHDRALVLGFDSFAPYLAHSPYFGAIAGRCANRIRDGRFSIDGTTHQLDRNFLGKHTLHGGSAGIGKRLWQIESQSADAVTLRIGLTDGEMGFPGAMTVWCRYALVPGGTLDIVLTAQTDAPTLCNLAHHSYFNLDGSATILEHELQVDAAQYTPVDAELIPTGEIATVTGSGFDFRQPRLLASAGIGGVIDHNLCLARERQAIRRVGTLRSPKSGLSMEIRTTEPGLQAYSGAKIAVPVPGLDGRAMAAFAGVALEPQVWPDAPNQPGFPAALLRPEQVYAQQSQYVFSQEATDGRG